MKAFNPIIGGDLATAKHVALAIAPEVAANMLIHLYCAQGAAAFEAINSLVLVQAFAKFVGPFHDPFRFIYLDATITLDGNRFQVFRAEHCAAAATCVDA